MIYYKHDDPAFTLTAYADGNPEPIAWALETAHGWELHDYISIHAFSSFAELQAELEQLYG